MYTHTTTSTSTDACWLIHTHTIICPGSDRVHPLIPCWSLSESHGSLAPSLLLAPSLVPHRLYISHSITVMAHGSRCHLAKTLWGLRCGLDPTVELAFETAAITDAPNASTPGHEPVDMISSFTNSPPPSPPGQP